MNFSEYIRAESLEQAYQLNQKKSSRILGGMIWMKMSRAHFKTVIDLSGLGLERIEETDEAFEIGCMATLRQLELHEGLNRATDGAVRHCVESIVGVQLRNLATIGGSLFSRFGFSDILTCFLALDCDVELYHVGRMSLAAFAQMKRDRDILVRVIVRKTPRRVCYLSMRNTRTDFPVLTCAVSLLPDENQPNQIEEARVVIGARPGKAAVYELTEKEKEMLAGQEETACRSIADAVGAWVQVGSNMRAGAEYRRHLAKVLTRRALESLMGAKTQSGTEIQHGGGTDAKAEIPSKAGAGAENNPVSKAGMKSEEAAECR